MSVQGGVDLRVFACTLQADIVVAAQTSENSCLGNVYEYDGRSPFLLCG